MDDLLRQVIHVYAEEVREQTQRIAEALLAMEADPAAVPARIEELYQLADCYLFPVASTDNCIGVPLSVLEAFA